MINYKLCCAALMCRAHSGTTFYLAFTFDLTPRHVESTFLLQASFTQTFSAFFVCFKSHTHTHTDDASEETQSLDILPKDTLTCRLEKPMRDQTANLLISIQPTIS